MTDSVSTETLLRRRASVLGPAYRLFYDEPLHLVRAEGVRLWDAEGREYLDAYNNVPSVGHCHPHLTQALSDQAAKLNTHTRYLHEAIVKYGERLTGYFPDSLSQVMFTCTGSEANDLALRVARHVTGGTGVIVTENAYHGVTLALAELSPSLGAGNPIGAHVRVVPAPARPDAGERFTADVSAAITDLVESGVKPAALLVDTAFASDGLYFDPPGFIGGGVAAIRAAGGIWIADEVQAGLGRPGDHMWVWQRHGIEPDLVTLGKPLGAGHPLAAMVARPELLEDFGNETRYFNTFGGNSVSAAVGMAVLDVIEREGLMENAARVGADLREGLEILASRHANLVNAVRGLGLYATMEFVDDDGEPSSARLVAVMNGLRLQGILVGSCGKAGNCLKIRPPLPFSSQDVDRFVSVLDQVLLSEDVQHA